MQTIDRLTIAKAFAAALDRCAFDNARQYLSEDCTYKAPQETLSGPDAIIASYRNSAEWGSRALDQVIYESEVTQGIDGLSVLYIDRITHHGRMHEYRCRQRLTLDERGKIVLIVHEELPGEREKLDEFFARSRVKR